MRGVLRILNLGPSSVRVEEPTSGGNTFVFFLGVGEEANISTSADVRTGNNKVVEIDLD